MRPLGVKILQGAILVVVLVLGGLHTQTHAYRVLLERQELIAQNWYELSPQEQSRALENYKRFQKLSPERQRSLEQQYQRWQELPSDEKDRIRRNYNRYRGMNSDQKEEFDKKYKQWRSQDR
jgi:hypothetical protein